LSPWERRERGGFYYTRSCRSNGLMDDREIRGGGREEMWERQTGHALTTSQGRAGQTEVKRRLREGHRKTPHRVKKSCREE
jgi:hypothetical protein